MSYPDCPHCHSPHGHCDRPYFPGGPMVCGACNGRGYSEELTHASSIYTGECKHCNGTGTGRTIEGHYAKSRLFTWKACDTIHDLREQLDQNAPVVEKANRLIEWFIDKLPGMSAIARNNTYIVELRDAIYKWRGESSETRPANKLERLEAALARLESEGECEEVLSLLRDAKERATHEQNAT